MRRFVHAKRLALKRRLSLALTGDFDPYPDIPEGMCFSPSQRNAAVAANLLPDLDWPAHGQGDVRAWQKKARQKWRDLLCLSGEPAALSVLDERDMPISGDYARRRVYVRFAEGCDAPVDIIRATASGKSGGHPPVIICMQGTNAGAHLNLGEVRMPADVYKVANGSALALQAADNGFIAVSFERACFGERSERHLVKPSGSPTVDAAFHALALSQTLLGQTVAELDALRRWIGSEVAPGAQVYLAGYSAAGTAAIAAAAAITEFAGIAAGGCVGFVRETLLARGTNGYNDIPGMLRWFEFDGQMALIAPRPCVVVAGESDHIWPHAGAEKVIASARSAWQEMDAGDRLRLERAGGGHTYYPELMWPALRDAMTAS